MAYMSQQKKAKIKAVLDPIMKEADLKYSLSIRNHSTIVCTVKSGSIDFIENHNAVMSDVQYLHYHPRAQQAQNYIDVNVYHYRDHFTGEALEIIGKIIAALNIDNHDNSDIQTDYFDVGHYVDLNIGRWDKPYELLTVGG